MSASQCQHKNGMCRSQQWSGVCHTIADRSLFSRLACPVGSVRPCQHANQRRRRNIPRNVERRRRLIIKWISRQSRSYWLVISGWTMKNWHIRTATVDIPQSERKRWIVYLANFHFDLLHLMKRSGKMSFWIIRLVAHKTFLEMFEFVFFFLKLSYLIVGIFSSKLLRHFSLFFCWGQEEEMIYISQ